MCSTPQFSVKSRCRGNEPSICPSPPFPFLSFNSSLPFFPFSVSEACKSREGRTHQGPRTGKYGALPLGPIVREPSHSLNTRRTQTARVFFFFGKKTLHWLRCRQGRCARTRSTTCWAWRRQQTPRRCGARTASTRSSATPTRTARAARRSSSCTSRRRTAS